MLFASAYAGAFEDTRPIGWDVPDTKFEWLGPDKSCTPKMGREKMSMVDGSLSLHGIEGLSIADASIMPRKSTGSAMAQSAVIGEMMSDVLIC